MGYEFSKELVMSLKSFHLIFITIVSLITVFFGYWCYNEWSLYNDAKYIILSILSIIFCIGLIFYSKWFLKEISRINAN